MYVTLTKKRLFVIFCAVCIAFFTIIQFLSAGAEEITLLTNADRVEYIKSLGVKLESDQCTSKEVVIPQEFGAVYSRYNTLQKQSGFNLSNFRGKKVTVYTYSCEDDRQVSLIIHKNKLIGGDIAETKLGGNMTALTGDNYGKGKVR